MLYLPHRQLTFLVMDPSWVWFEVAESFAEPATFGDGSGSAGGLFGFGLLCVARLTEPLIVRGDVESACGEADHVVLDQLHAWA